METKPLDFILSTILITAFVVMALFTAWVLSMDNRYHIVLDIAVFLLSYGLYTIGFLFVFRRFSPYPVGRVSMDSWEFTCWKLNAVLVDLATKALAPFITVFTEPLILAMLGAKIGKQVAIAGVIRDHPLIDIGDGATVGQNSVITAHAITHGEIVLKPVKVGSNSVVGIGCIVMPGVTLGENAVLAPGAVALEDAHIDANELWGGIPAKKIKALPPR